MMDELEVSDDENYEYDEDGTPVSVTDTNGILYVTVNSASGPKYYSIKTDQNFEYAAVMNQDQQKNISRVDITSTSFTVTTYSVETLDVVDTFTIYRTCEHNYESEVTTEATCTEDGVITYTCTECGDIYTETITATGHSYKASEADESGYLISSGNMIMHMAK